MWSNHSHTIRIKKFKLNTVSIVQWHSFFVFLLLLVSKMYSFSTSLGQRFGNFWPSEFYDWNELPKKKSTYTFPNDSYD